jgi:uncharacterized protein (TIRG00374 family)
MSERMAESTRRRSVLVAKVLVAAGLTVWLARSGTLDFTTLGIFLARPELLALSLATYGVVIIIATLRWRTLLTLAGLERPWSELLALQMTASFLNAVIPGAVGGDVVKALAVTRGEDGMQRTTVLLLVLVERLCGLVGLIITAVLVLLTRGLSVWTDPLLGRPATAIALLGLATTVGPLIFMTVVRSHDGSVVRVGERHGTSRQLVSQLVAATRLVSANPSALVPALALSMGVHAFLMTFFTFLTGAITSSEVSFIAIASTFPLGLLTVTLPIAPLGLGVGHLAFERLLGAIGIEGGANAFNLFVFGRTVPSLLGVLPYFSLRARGHLVKG